MKLLVLALAAHTVSQPSLGIGLDVVPAVYMFAAARFDFMPDLRLSTCDHASCRWSTGHGVDLAAYVVGYDLDVRRLEASVNRDPGSDPDRDLWFRKACETIVALTLSEADRSVVDPLTKIIVNRGQTYARGVRFYGALSEVGPPSKPRQVCGATIEAQ